MRFYRTALLVSGVSILSALNVVSAPLKIAVVEEVGPEDVDTLLRSVRIGLAGANANANGHSPHIDTDTDALDPDFVRIAIPDMGSGHNPEHPSDGNANSDTLEFPELPPLIKEAIEKAREEARKAAAAIAEQEHEIEEEIKDALDIDNKEIPVVHCANEKSWRSKANKVENWFRKLVGLALVQRSECIEGNQLPIQSHAPSEGPRVIATSFHVVTEENSTPVARPAGVISGIVEKLGSICHMNTVSAAADDEPAFAAMPEPAYRQRGRPGRLWGWRRPQTFWGRLQKALYSLSPWEGRALAFVLGCGLGVLIRMIYVFIVLGVRFWQCRRLQAIQLAEDDAQVTIFDVNELEEEILPPPVYKENETQIEIETEKRSID